MKPRDINHAIVAAMCGEPLPGWPTFPFKLHLAAGIAYWEKDGVVHRCSNHGIDSCIAEYWVRTLPNASQAVLLGSMAASDAVKIRKLWFITAKPVDNPAKE